MRRSVFKKYKIWSYNEIHETINQGYSSLYKTDDKLTDFWWDGIYMIYFGSAYWAQIQLL